ncbi:MAG: 2-oxoacid:acceptor oxidoreductase family protein [Thermodesulfobacteriota bacterium]
MMELQIVIAGLGGEGIILMTMILAEGAFRHGYPIISTETHGMAMRGGSVISQLKIGDFQSPMISYGQADLLIATSEREAERNLLYLKEMGGKVFLDSANGGPHSIDARGIAQQLGTPRAANMVLLGYAIANLNGFNPQLFEEALAYLSPASFSEMNLKAFRRGFEKGKI